MWRQRLGVERSARQIFEHDGHGARFGVNVHLAEKLHTVGGRRVLAVAAPVFVECFGDFAHVFGHHVVSQRAIGQFDLGRDWAVGVNGVAAVQEKVGLTWRICS